MLLETIPLRLPHPTTKPIVTPRWEEVSPAAHQLAFDSTRLVGSLCIIRRPRDCVCNTWIYANGTEERAGVFNARLMTSKKHAEANDSEQACANIAEPPLTCTVCEPLKKEGVSGHCKVGREIGWEDV